MSVEGRVEQQKQNQTTTSQQCFFLPRNGKSGRSSFLALFWLFSLAKIGFLAHFFGTFLAYFLISRPLKSEIFLGLERRFLGHNSEMFLIFLKGFKVRTSWGRGRKKLKSLPTVTS